MKSRFGSLPEGTPSYAVRVGDQFITGFRNPTARLGQGDNKTKPGEIRVSFHCIAILGALDATPYKWTGDPLAPRSIARQLGGSAKVVTVRSR